MKYKNNTLIAFAAVAATVGSSSAQVLTTSPTSGGLLPSTISPVGGIVADLIGISGTRVTSQLAASSLFVGSAPATSTLVIGTQTGFAPATIAALGGGLSEVAFRVSLFDGDSASGEFDDGDNTFAVNGIQIQNFSDVTATNSNGDGTVLSGDQLGFPSDGLATGFFTTSDSTALADIHTQLLTGSLEFQLIDVDPGEQFFDFTQGLDSSVIDTGSGPIISNVPEPSNVLSIAGLCLVPAFLRKRRK